ncbi:MAG: hypothetical protein M0R32_02730 [Candidatus Cloacimonetes bacterium]|jgi:hypothetical protein|nr:hypothetical protein [Candidatus Cloacimonadota bacterium]
MKQTDKYKLKYLERGDFYSSRTDMRRMSAIDTHLGEYVKIIGNGVIEGWDIQSTIGRNVTVRPGWGIINGLFTETQWVQDSLTGEPIRKIQAQEAGHLIIAEIPGWSNPASGPDSWIGSFYRVGGGSVDDALGFSHLGPEGEDLDNDGIVEGVLNPYYKAPSDQFYDNPYVKAVESGSVNFLLDDDSEGYILARRVSSDPLNTFAEIFIDNYDSSGTDSILLARIVVRSGEVIEIDYKAVRQLKGFYGTVSKIATYYISEHKHGGSQSFDPQALRLETDIRNTRLVEVFSDGSTRYKVFGNKETSSEYDHKHTYVMDSNGDGYTQEVLGDADYHYHLIEDSTIQESLKVFGSILEPHTHSIGEEYDSWDSKSLLRVTINGEVVESGFTPDPTNQSIKFDPGVISVKNGVYKTFFQVEDEQDRTFSLESEELSLKNFIIRMMALFANQYRGLYQSLDEDGQLIEPSVRDCFSFLTVDGEDVEQGKESYVFADYTPTNIWPEGPYASLSTGVQVTPLGKTLYGADPSATSEINEALVSAEKGTEYRGIEPYLEQQASLGAMKLVNPGDSFTLLPYLARFVPITLVSAPQVDEVVVEILENVEVQGTLKSESIQFIKAEKFTSGAFEKWTLPAIGHSGRIREQVLPEYSKTYTDDGYSFYSIPTRALVSFGHGHLVSTTRTGDGITLATTINGEIAVSENVGGDLLKITHTHPIISGIVSEVSNDSINAWQQVQDDTTHSHDLDVQVGGDAKSVFSVLEDIDGNLYFGTSNGLMAKPISGGYSITISGYEYQSQNSNAYEASLEVFKRHADLVGEFIEFADNDYALTNYSSFSSKMNLACSLYSYSPIFSGQRKDVDGQNLPISVAVEIEPKTIVRVDSFYKLSIKTEEDLLADDEIIYTSDPKDGVVPTTLAALYNYILESADESDSDQIMYLVKQSFDKSTVWSMSLNESGSVITCSNKQFCISSNNNTEWESIEIPSGISILKGITKDSKGDILIPTDSGMLNFSKYFAYKRARILSDIDGELETFDVIESSPLNLLASTSEGVYLSTDRGNSWTSSLPDVEVIQFSRDHWLDSAGLDSGHIHYLLVNQNGDGVTTNAFDQNGDSYSGSQHIHQVKSWEIEDELGHSHEIQTSIFALSKTKEIFKTVDNGTTWVKITDAPTEFGEIGNFTAAFEMLLGSCEKGLAKFSDGKWEIVLSKKVRSFSWSYLFDRLFIGSDNYVYEMTDANINKIVSFSGGPVPGVSIENSKKHFGYSYNNLSNKIVFREQIPASSQVGTALAYDIWKATDGSWDPDKDYEIFIGDEIAISTKTGIDRRAELGLEFTVDPSNGSLSFLVSTTLSATIFAGQAKLSIKDPNGFKVGGTIALIKYPPKVTAEDMSDLTDAERVKLEREVAAGIRVEKRTITSIANTTLFVDKQFHDKWDLPAKVRLLSVINGNVDIYASIYQTYFEDIGKASHEDVEDSLSIESAGAPYHLSSVHLSNLSELTLAMKYALPEVDSEYKNWEAYTMRYSRDSGDADFIEGAFNVQESNLSSGVSIETPLNPTKSKSINVIASGDKTYSDLIFVGSDAGLFAAKKEPDIPPNWFAVYTCPAGTIYDINFPGNDNILVAGENGLYITKGGTLNQWNAITKSGTKIPSYFTRNRWINFGTAGGSWWNSWDENGNLIDSDITNTIVVGGQDFVMISSNGGKSWTVGLTPMDLSNRSYLASDFLPLRSGQAILVANSVVGSSGDIESRLLITSGFGGSWNGLCSFYSKNGKVVSVNNSLGGNTELNVIWNDDYEVQANSMIGNYAIFSGEKYKIIRNRNETLVLFGLVPASNIKPEDNFTVEAPPINGIAEDSSSTIYVSSGGRLLTDVGTRKPINKKLGTILEINKSATVDGIDASGVIDSIKVLPSFMGEEKKSSLVCTLDRQAIVNDFVNKEIAITGYLAPSVSFISPYAEEVVKSSTLIVSLSVQSFDLGTSGKVSIKLDSREAIITSSSLYVFEGVSIGSHTITAQLLDSDEKSLTNDESSAAISFSTEFSVNTPSVSIVSPVEGEALTSGTFKAVFKVTNFTTGVEGYLTYSLDDTGDVPITPFGSGVVEMTIQGASDGLHNLKAKLINNFSESVGETALTSFSIVSGGLPSIFITSPIDSMTLTLPSVPITYNVSNILIPGEASVRFTLDSSQEFITTNASTFTLTNISNGDHTLKAELLDSNLKPFSNASATASISFKVDQSLSQQPTVTITYPFDGISILKSDYIDLIYIIENFEMPVDGGVILKINDGAEVFLTTLESYKIPGNVGSYVVTATLASSPTVKLSNELASMSVSFEVVNEISTTTRSIAPNTTVKSLPPPNISSKQLPGVDVPKSVTMLAREDSTALSDRRWKIIANSSSALTGSTTITVNGIVPLDMVNQSFRILGDSSVIYLVFDQPVSVGEFNEGLLYVDEKEPNAFKSYSIVRQLSDRVEIKENIDPSETGTPIDVEVGQKIRLLPKTGESTVWMNFSREWGEDELSGSIIRVGGSQAGQEVQVSQETDVTDSVQDSFAINDNDENSITLYKTNPYSLRTGDIISLQNTVMLPLMSFQGKVASKNLDHYHESELIGEFLHGNISSISLFGASFVDVVTNSESLNHQLLIDNPTLLAGKKILFCDSSDPRRSYRKEIVSIINDTIRVKRGSINDWAVNSSSIGIADGWRWNIDARRYGKTKGIYYDDFVVFQARLSEDAAIGQSYVKINDISGVVMGDSVEIWNSLSNVQAFEVLNVTSPDLVELDSQLLKTYKISEGSHLRVRRSSVSEDISASSSTSSGTEEHSHFIKDGEVYEASIEEYTLNGYPYSHSHELDGFIQDVKALSFEYDSGRIIAVGNNSKIYTSNDNGQSWKVMLDAETLLGDWAGSFVSINKSYEGDLLIGTNDGRFIGQGVPEQSTLITYPGNDDLMPTSSSLSSYSSSSSTSSESSMSTNLSQSTSSTSSIIYV